MGGDTAIGDVDGPVTIGSCFLNDALGWGTQIENIGTRGVGEVGIREGEGSAAGSCRVEADASGGRAICQNEFAGVVGVLKDVCNGCAGGSEGADSGYAAAAPASPESIPPLVLMSLTRVASTI